MMMDEKMKESGVKTAGPEGVGLISGCTACVVLITPDMIYCANAGDSRAVLK